MESSQTWTLDNVTSANPRSGMVSPRMQTAHTPIQGSAQSVINGDRLAPKLGRQRRSQNSLAIWALKRKGGELTIGNLACSNLSVFS